MVLVVIFGCVVTGIALFHWRQLRLENAQIQALCRELQGELEAARLENAGRARNDPQPLSARERTELLRLRNRAGQLGTATNELQQLRRELRRLVAENQQLRSSPAAPASEVAVTEGSELVLKKNWTFSGYATPEDAFQSMVWAMNQGNLEVLLECLTPEERAGMLKNWGDKPAEQIARERRQKMDDVTGFRILDRREIAADRIALTIYAEGKGDSAGMLFQRSGNDWKMAGKTPPREFPGSN